MSITPTASPFVVVSKNEILYEADTQREADTYVDSYKACFSTEELNGTMPVARPRKRGDK